MNFLVELGYYWNHYIWPILMFLLGLDLVVFVHELGHFLMAKKVGIKVERFAIGFGPKVVGFKWGETEYVLLAFPLGGYVKMLGQEDFKPLPDQQPDPRAFNNKSVGARLAVIAAGVVMNVILAAVMFLAVAMVGKSFPDAVVGGTAEGFPASMAEIHWQPAPGAATQPAAATQAVSRGLEPGDRIVRIDGKGWVLNFVGHDVTRFSDLMIISALADRDEEFTFTIARGQLVGKARISVRQNPATGMQVFGIEPAQSLTMREPQDVIIDSPFEDGDTLVVVNGRPLEHHWDLEELQPTLDGKPVVLTVRRGGQLQQVTVRPVLQNSEKVFYLADGKKVRGDVVAASQKDKTVTVRQADQTQVTIAEQQLAATDILDILGLIPRVKVLAVTRNSPAHKAGLLPGDIILSYGDHSAPTVSNLRKINEKIAGAGADMTVLRGEQTVQLHVAPTRRGKAATAMIGIVQAVDLEHLIVADVRENSPAAAAGIERLATILAVNEQPVKTWYDLYDRLKGLEGNDIKITYAVGSRVQTVSLGAAAEEFDPQDYAFNLFGSLAAFEPLQVRVLESNPLKAMAWGAKETSNFVLTTYLTLKSLVTRTLPASTLSGPVGIGALAMEAARHSFLDLVYLVALLSATVAVINFLPFPVVDGGYAVFLLIEKVRGRPLPVKVQNIVQMIGLVLIGMAFIALTWNDIARIVRNLW